MNNTALGAEKTKKENIIFISDAHEKFYYEKIKEVRYQDVYHKSIHCVSLKDISELQINCMKLLREMQISFKQYRADSRLGRPTVKYPIFNIYSRECWVEEEYSGNRYLDNEYGHYEDVIFCRVYYEPTIQLNVEHALIKVLKERMEEEVRMEEAFENVLNWRIEAEEVECYKVRCDFAKRKSLYKSS